MNLSRLFIDGWAVVPDAFAQVESLVTAAERLSGSYRAARIGRGSSAHLEETVRSDKIMWLDNGVDPAVDAYLKQMEAIRETVNQQCFLGLFDYECHFANFEPGDFYKTHVDAFADEHNPRGNRKLSSVFYLNKDWRSEHGGELVLYAPDSGEEITRVLPQLGTLVLFLSEEFPHEVLPARRTRRSVTGWFRTRPVGI
jgi:SM-20-related protein